MKTKHHLRKLRLSLLSVSLLGLISCLALPSCGTIKTHAGIEHESSFDLGDYGQSYYDGHHHKKPKHHKKHKKPKHHRHHHDD